MESKKDWSSVIPEGLSDEWKEFVVWHLDRREKQAQRAKENFDEEAQRAYIQWLLDGRQIFSEENKKKLTDLMVELHTLIFGEAPILVQLPARPTGPQFPDISQPAA